MAVAAERGLTVSKRTRDPKPEPKPTPRERPTPIEPPPVRHDPEIRTIECAAQDQGRTCNVCGVIHAANRCPTCGKQLTDDK